MRSERDQRTGAAAPPPAIRALLGAVVERRELPGGYGFRLDGSAIRLSQAAEWMEQERKCCPFLTMELETTGRELDFWIRLSGPEGAEELLASWPSAARSGRPSLRKAVLADAGLPPAR